MKEQINFNQDKIAFYAELFRSCVLVSNLSIKKNIANFFMDETEKYIKDVFGEKDDFKNILQDFRNQTIKKYEQKYGKI